MNNLPLHENIPFNHSKFSVKVRNYQSDIPLRPQWHEHIELLFFFDGEGTVTCNENTFPVKKGDLVFINPSEIHTYTPETTLSFCCILLYPWFFSDIEYDGRIIIENHIQGDTFVKDCVEALLKESAASSPFSDMVIKSHAYTLTAYLMRNYAVSEMTEKDTLLQRAKLKRADNILYYIHNHYHERITTKSLADLCYMTESHFCRFFKKNFGKTPLTYINEYRIEIACERLLTTPKSVTEIALSTGFEDINYFSRTFKKLKGLSATKFRER